MIYSGIIKGQNNTELPNAYVEVLQNGNSIATIHADVHGYWSIDSDMDGGLLEVGKVFSFCAPGYPCFNLAANIIPSQFDVDLSKKQSYIPYLIGGAALALVAMNATKKKKIAGIDKDDVKTGMYIVGGVLLFTTANKILQALGIFKDPNDTSLDNESNSTNSPWSITYWQNFYPSGSGTRNLTTDQAAAIASKIYSDLGVFFDDEDGVIGAIHELKTKADVSFVAYTFYYNQGRDLLTYLRNGRGSLPQNGLSAADVANLNTYVHNLPNS